MNYKENQAHYYEFILDESLFYVNKNKKPYGNNINDYINSVYQLNQLKEEELKGNPFYSKLHEYINEKFNKNGIRLSTSGGRAFIITNDEKNIEECKEFCQYLAGNTSVLELLIKHREDRTAFNAGLETIYNTLQLTKELGINNGITNKRLKL